MPQIVLKKNFGSGGGQLTPRGSAGRPALVNVLNALIDDIAASNSATQSGTATLVAGTVTINSGVAFSANAKILVSVNGAIAGSANFSCVTVSARTPGADGVAEFTITAVIADGTLDADAAGDVDWLIHDPDAVATPNIIKEA
jgi:hypothetical protein